MLESGLIEETRSLLEKGYSPDLKPFQAIGYKETVAYLDGQLDIHGLREKILINTRRLAKRQRTWFRKEFSEAVKVPPDPLVLMEHISPFLEDGGAL
jgi:tRNA dimethylallyltransferase